MKYVSGLVKWVGGKKSLLSYILPLFRKDIDTYVEVFGGAGAVLLNFKIGGCKKIYNDYNIDLVNLFRVVKYRPAEFINEVNRYQINSRVYFAGLSSIINNTPVPLSIIEENLRILKEGGADEKIIKDYKRNMLDMELNNAVRFYEKISLSFAGGAKSWNCQPSTIIDIANKIYEKSQILKDVIIERNSYEKIIPNQDKEGTFFYCDPPYFNTENYYDADFNKNDHEKLRNILADIKGKFLLSYNDCEEIRELYKDFYILSIERPNNISSKKGAVYKELLIANYDICSEYNQRLYQQLQLDVHGEGEELCIMYK